ncbi:MAG: DUF4388 domain-containing protein [Planctomycetota bacterium]
MPIAPHVKLLALDLACQRLARRAKGLASINAAIEAGMIEEVDRMVTLALAMLGEKSAQPAVAEAETKKKPSGNILLRMLRGKDEEKPASPKPVENLPPSPQHTLALRGEGASIPPPDLLGFLSAQHKTGTLEVVTPTEAYTLEFLQGDVVHAHVNPTVPRQRLGDILVSSGAITREDIERIRAQGMSQRLGEVLLRENLVTPDQLTSALRTQVQLLFNRMFAAEVTRFQFWNGPPILAHKGMRLNAMALIFEGARTHDENLIVDPRDYPDQFPVGETSAGAAEAGGPPAFDFEPLPAETGSTPPSDEGASEPKSLIAEARDPASESTKAALLEIDETVAEPDAHAKQDG